MEPTHPHRGEIGTATRWAGSLARSTPSCPRRKGLGVGLNPLLLAAQAALAGVCSRPPPPPLLLDHPGDLVWGRGNGKGVKSSWPLAFRGRHDMDA